MHELGNPHRRVVAVETRLGGFPLSVLVCLSLVLRFGVVDFSRHRRRCCGREPCLCFHVCVSAAPLRLVRCRCGPSSLLGPHSGTGLPFLLVPVAALLSLVVLPFAAGLHLPTAALSSSVLLVVAVAGLLLLSSLLDMGDPLPLPWPLEALAARSARLQMLSCRVWQCPVERQPSGGLRGLAL